MRTPRALLLVTVLLAACVAGGCGAGSSSSGGSRTLTYWATNEAASLGIDKKIYSRIVADFEKKTGVDVKITVVPWSDLLKKILTATASGQGPDVVNIGNTWSASLQATGAFVKFDKETMKAIGGKDKFVDIALQSNGAPGKVPTALPLYMLPDPVLFYNKKLFEQAGVAKPPETLSEFRAVAEKLTRDTDGDGNPDQWGFAFPGTDWYTMVHRAYVLSKQQGGSFFDEHGNPTFATDENVEAVHRIVSLVGDVAPPAVAEYKNTNVLSEFVNGNVAMIMAPLNTLKALKDRGMTSEDFGVAMRPIPESIPSDGAPYRGYLSGTNISVFKSTDNRKAALKFVEYMTSKEQQIALAKAYGDGYLPVTKEAFSSSAYGGRYRELGMQVIKHSVPMPQVKYEAEMETFVGNAVVRLIRKAATGAKVTESDVRSALEKANQKLSARAG